MSAYPENIVTFREKENLPGLFFDVENKKTFFVEDIQKIENELIAIEEVLGVQVQGEYETLAARLADFAGGGGFTPWEASDKVSAAGDTLTLDISGCEVGKLYAFHGFLQSVANVNSQCDFNINGVNTNSQYYGRYYRSIGTSVNTDTTEGRFFCSLGTNQFAKVEGTFTLEDDGTLHMKWTSMVFTASAAAQFREDYIIYKNTSAAALTALNIVFSYGGGFTTRSFIAAREIIGGAV